MVSERREEHSRGGYRAASMHRKLEGLVDAYRALYRQAPGHRAVERRDGEALSGEELRRRYLLRNRPVIVRNGVGDPLKSRIAGALLEIDGLAPFGFARFARVSAADYE